LIEILSPPTREFDRNERLEDYKTVQTLEYILLVDPDLPQVRLYRRDSNRGWISGKTVGLDAAVELPSLGVLLRLADIYAGLAFGHAQR